MCKRKKPAAAKSQLTSVTPEELVPLFGDLFERATVKQLLALKPGAKLYWRILTPLVILWGFVYQRLNKDHSCDAYVSHLHSGAVDGLDRATPAERLPSVGLHSESTSAYVQGRNRLPLWVLSQAYHLVAQKAQAAVGACGEWHGHAVRLLDGVCFRLPAIGDIATTYPPTQHDKGASYWCQVRSLIACDWFSQCAVAMAETCFQSSETDLVDQVVAQERCAHALYVADRAFGIYRVVQVLAAYHQEGLLRLRKDRALALLRRNRSQAQLKSGDSCPVLWAHTRHDQPFPALPTLVVPGRLIYWHLAQDGFRPLDLYLFTTLTDELAYPTPDLVQLYAQRWRVEVHFRYIKTALDMTDFTVKSAALFRKELAAGLLTYNLVMLLMTKAALLAGTTPYALSFSQCCRRILACFTHGVPAWVRRQHALAAWLFDRLASCRLPHQPLKLKHEPRKVRYKPRSFPALKGERLSARLENLAALHS